MTSGPQLQGFCRRRREVHAWSNRNTLQKRKMANSIYNVHADMHVHGETDLGVHESSSDSTSLWRDDSLTMAPLFASASTLQSTRFSLTAPPSRSSLGSTGSEPVLG